MRSHDELKWKIISNGVLLVFTLAAVLPFLLLLMASVSKESVVMTNGYSFFPQEFSPDAYNYILSQADTLGRGYLNTIIVTMLGTGVSMLLTSMFAYALSNDRLPGVKLLNFLCIFTMLFSGGQVASYYVWSSMFKVRDTVWGLVLPNLLMNAFNVILVKNYFINSIHVSLKEAARIDGCGEFKIFRKIVMPLSIPINATIGLMTGLIYWNDWVNGLYYLTARNGSR
ncbi:MAG TPA: carbohydrate ABC transporter permease, partial [Lachnospiraceae bacterium]|nr:carbohydrate ABC transporter permease [Lachnospiraceae bacterium]